MANQIKYWSVGHLSKLPQILTRIKKDILNTYLAVDQMNMWQFFLTKSCQCKLRLLISFWFDLWNIKMIILNHVISTFHIKQFLEICSKYEKPFFLTFMEFNPFRNKIKDYLGINSI